MSGQQAPFPRGRIIALAALLIVLAFIGAFAFQALQRPAPEPSLVGGPFTLVDQNGRTVDESLLKDRWSVVFFGYTYCPDFCPATLQTLASGINELGPKAKDVQVILITVDPARDTPEQLKTYLSSPVFPRNSIGLTGTEEQVAAAIKTYRAYAAKNGEGADYLMDHSTVAYLMDPQGRFDRVLAYGLTPEEIARQIRNAMGG